MKRIEITLSQQTPMLHFDHTPGATLRATEVKPKLDRYLIKNLFKNSKDCYKQFLIENSPGEALDYKMHIEAPEIGLCERLERINTPMYFGNTKEKEYHTEQERAEIKEQNKVYSWSKVPVKLRILAPEGADWITKDSNLAQCIVNFFFETNFGTRQTKGYGGFRVTVIKIDGGPVLDMKYAVSDHQFGRHLHFTLQTPNFNNAMSQVRDFYAALRSGINRPGFYMKPLLFLYAKKEGIQWEKKTIKENFASKRNDGESPALEIQRKKYKNDKDGPLHYSSQKKRIVKTVLGLSSFETWSVACEDQQGRKLKYPFNQIKIAHIPNPEQPDSEIERVMSPLTFKLFEGKKEDQDIYDVYVLINEEQEELIKNHVQGQEFTITAEKKNPGNIPTDLIGTTKCTVIKQEKFSLDRFFAFIRDEKQFNFDAVVKPNSDPTIYKPLSSIFNQLQSENNTKKEL